jgi:hypothetical protein
VMSKLKSSEINPACLNNVNQWQIAIAKPKNR